MIRLSTPSTIDLSDTRPTILLDRHAIVKPSLST
jgi:hypothetical protein